MAQPALEDLRNLLRRMCAYTRDYRPAAVDCARDLEQLLYAIDARYRIGLEEFARTTVLPIYESRPRISPEDAITSDGDDEFLKEVTGALTGPSRTRPRAARLAPYVFVAGLGFLVVLLFALSAVKFVTEQLASAASVPDDVPTDEEDEVAVASPADDGLIRVNLWLPSDAQAQLGDVFVPESGAARVPPGRTLMQAFFNDGRAADCTFDAVDGMRVHLVTDAGVEKLLMDDSEETCVRVREAPGGEGEEADG